MLSVAVVATFTLASCGGGYSEEAGKLADDICKCVGEETTSEEKVTSCVFSTMLGSPQMEEFKDDKEGAEKFGKEVQNALKDKCEPVYDKLKEMDK